MKEESKFRIGRIFYILLIFSFVVISAEGILFYGNKADTPFFFKLLLILQNIIKAFGFKTVISLNDAVGVMNSHPSVIHTIICYAYGLAVFTAPYCTLTFAYKILERLMSFVLNFGFVQKKDNIVIFGYNDDVKTILEDSDESDLLKKYCIYIVSEKEISSEEKYNISRAGRRFYNFDMSKADRKEDCRSLLNKVRAKYAKYIILFDESSMKNFALLQIFSLNNDDGGFILNKDTKIICRCEDYGISELISDYFDAGNSSDRLYDLELLSIPELQVRKMYEDIPLYTFYKGSGKPVKDWTVHILIAGFGKVGQQAVLQAMNLGVFSHRNEIIIDVFDNDISKKADIFAAQFSLNSFEFEDSCIRMKKEIADGTLVINFYNMDVLSHQFYDKVCERELKTYTYAIVAIDRIDVCVGCATWLVKAFDEAGNTRIPILVRMDSNSILSDYITNSRTTSPKVTRLTQRKRAVSLHNILNEDINIRAKEFNYIYSNIDIVKESDKDNSGGSKYDMDDHWRKISLSKRESSKAGCAYEKVKDVIIGELCGEGQSPKDAIDAVVGESGSLLTKSGDKWHYDGNDDRFLAKLKENDFALTMVKTEHRRWCCFMASKGWKSGSERNDSFKRHDCLVTFDELAANRKTIEKVKYDMIPLMIKLRK